MREFWCESEDARLYGVEQGDGPAIMLFHGGGGTHQSCLGLAGCLAEQFRVITPDLRGSGRSRDGRPLSWDHLADDAVALMDQFGLDRAVVGGPSMGAATALRCTLRHPDRVAALIMITPAYGGAQLGLTASQAEAFARMDNLAKAALQDGVEALRPLYQAAPAIEAYFDAAKDSIDVASFAATSALMASGAQPFARNAELEAITAPTLVIPGDDPMHPAAVSSRLAVGIAGCVVRTPAPSGAGSDLATAKFITEFLGNL